MNEWLHGFVQQVVALAGAHPWLAGLMLCLFAGAEAIVIVGAVLPGEAVVLALAAAAGAAGVNPWIMVLWTTLGAALGDGVSFWLGHSYGREIIQWPWLRTHPHLLESGERFIERQGIKAVIIGRFLPALRAIVPVAAGILGMEPKRFYLANILSAFGWALVHILPAAALGLAYKTLGEVSGRITVFIALALVLVFVFLWLVRLVVLRLAPLVAGLYKSAIRWLSKRPDGLSKGLARLLDPARPGFAGITTWSGVLIAATIGSISILENLVSGDPLVRADTAINHLVQGLRTGPGDVFMVVITSMGDAFTMIAGAVVLIGILLYQRAWKAAAAVAGVLASASLFVPLIKIILHKPRPIEIYSGASSYSFPSGHTAMTAVLFGVLAVLVSRGLGPRWKIAIFSLAGLWVSLVGASRIYLSAHWPSDVMGGMLLGTVLTAVFALVTAHSGTGKYNRLAVAIGVTATIALAGGYHAAANLDKNLARYAHRTKIQNLALDTWIKTGWRALPARRIDLGGEREEPLLLQWAGTIPAITSAMIQSGWQKSAPFTWRDALELLSPDAKISNIAPLPVLHNGKLAALTLVRTTGAKGPDSNERLVLRFWRSGYAVTSGQITRPVFVAALSREILVQPVSWVAIIRERQPEATAIARLEGALRNNRRLKLRKPSPVLIWQEAV
ncbi:MAG TPA: phosphatase PAP2 family protein [Rhizobiales bacterium]|nr:phosphatase PAP2 family protein [Hyphomicrobiales bacterium]